MRNFMILKSRICMVNLNLNKHMGHMVWDANHWALCYLGWKILAIQLFYFCFEFWLLFSHLMFKFEDPKSLVQNFHGKMISWFCQHDADASCPFDFTYVGSTCAWLCLHHTPPSGSAVRATDHEQCIFLWLEYNLGQCLSVGRHVIWVGWITRSLALHTLNRH